MYFKKPSEKGRLYFENASMEYFSRKNFATIDLLLGNGNRISKQKIAYELLQRVHYIKIGNYCCIHCHYDRS